MADTSKLDRIVGAYLRTMYSRTCFACAVIGIQIFMCIYGLSIFLETPRGQRGGRSVYVAISFIILALYSLQVLPNAYRVFLELYKPSNSIETLELINQLNETTWLLNIHAWTGVILLWVGDGLMVYRCYIVWTGRRVVAILPVVIYLGAIATSLACQITGLKGDASSNTIGAAWVILSVAVNCTVTLLISMRLLRMKKQQEKILDAADSKLYLGIIAILIESAVPLSLAGIAVVATNWKTSVAWTTAYNTFFTIWFSFNALSPQMIIFRVTIGRSWTHSTRKESHLSTLAFQPNAFRSSGEINDAEAIGSLHENGGDKTDPKVEKHESAL